MGPTHLDFGVSYVFVSCLPRSSEDRTARPNMTATTRIDMPMMYGKALLGAS
jgi:hypothetical protein